MHFQNNFSFLEKEYITSLKVVVKGSLGQVKSTERSPSTDQSQSISRRQSDSLEARRPDTGQPPPSRWKVKKCPACSAATSLPSTPTKSFLCEAALRKIWAHANGPLLPTDTHKKFKLLVHCQDRWFFDRWQGSLLRIRQLSHYPT